MSHTPFAAIDPPVEFKSAGISYVKHPESAHIIVGRSIQALVTLAGWAKNFAVWTSEPRFDLHLMSPVRVGRIASPVHIMNTYTGVYADNYLGMWREPPLLNRDALLKAFVSKPSRTEYSRVSRLPTVHTRDNCLVTRHKNR